MKQISLKNLKYFLIVFFISVFLVNGVMYLFFYQEKDNLFLLIQSRETQIVNAAAKILENKLKNAVLDLKILAQHDDIRSFIERGNNKTHIISDFYEFINFKRVYYQIRLLNYTGQEIARVNNHNETITVVKDKQLQNKGGTYYFKELTQKLEKSDLYISSLDLNMENGKVEYPEVPIVRFALPLKNEKKQKYYLVVNYFAKDLLMDLQSFVLKDINQIILIHPNGNWFSQSYKNHKIHNEFFINQKESLRRTFPDLLSNDSTEIKNFVSNKGFFTQLSLVVDGIKDVQWKVVSFIPTQKFNQQFKKLENTFLYLFIIGNTLLFFLIFFLSRVLVEKKRITKENKKLSLAVDQSYTTVVITDKNGIIEYANPNFEVTTGFTNQEVLGKKTNLFRSGFHDKEFYQKLWTTIKSGKTWSGIFLNKKKNGNLYWEKAVISPVMNKKNEITHFIAIKLDITAQKNAEDSLKESERRFRTIIDNSPIGMSIINEEGVFEFVNPAFCKLYGYKFHELIGEDAGIIIPDKAKEKWKNRLRKFFEDQHFFLKGEWSIFTKSGQKKSIYLDSVKFLGQDGKIKVLNYLIDITQSKDNAQIIRQQSRFLETVIDSIPLGIFVKDAQKDFQFSIWNKQMETYFNINRKDILGKSDYDFFDKIQADIFRNADKQVVKSKMRLNVDAENISTDHGIFVAHTIKIPILDENGMVISLLGILEDLEEKNRLKVELKENQELYRLLFDMASDAIYVHELNTGYKLGNFIDVNQQAFERLGYNRYELLQMSPDKITEMESNKIKKILETLVKDKKVIFEAIHLSKDQKKIPVEVSSRIVEYKNKKVVFSIVRDITERKKLEKQDKILLQQSKLAAMGEMIGAIAHQWRQPLNEVGLIFQDILDSYEFDELNKENLTDNVNMAYKQLSFMSETIDDFRNFFKIDKEKHYFPIADNLKNALELSAAQMRNSYIKIKQSCHSLDGYSTDKELLAENYENIEIISCQQCDLMIYGHGNDFIQVILNIISNARDAILESVAKGNLKNDEGLIQIDIFPEDGMLRINLTNNGGAIPEIILDRIFEPYFSTKEEGKGTGIGLYMAKMIIEENMNGKLWAENVSDHSVNFIITLPAVRRGSLVL